VGDDVGRAGRDDEIAEGQDLTEWSHGQHVTEHGEVVAGLLQAPLAAEIVGARFGDVVHDACVHQRRRTHGHGPVEGDHEGVESQSDRDHPHADETQVGQAARQQAQERHDEGHPVRCHDLEQGAHDQQRPAFDPSLPHMTQPSPGRVAGHDPHDPGHQRHLHAPRRYWPTRPDFWTLRCA
jgi:hypothetical protein